MPIGDSFSGRFVGVEGSQLGQWNCHVSAAPPDQHAHIAGAGERCVWATLRDGSVKAGIRKTLFDRQVFARWYEHASSV
jgi:hypothetical protein